ncbi:hypothetical protein J6187_003797 [Salmonella enterica]|nr:hypothetical protein [Salmonella enterica]EHG9741819.1 hypothetical protein [Salmonella enterica]
MFNKLLISSVSCINEFADEVPQSVFVRIDTALVQRIRELAAYVKTNDLHSSTFFFYDGHWSETFEQDIEDLMAQTAFGESDSSGQEAMLRDVIPSCRTELPLIRVMKESFQLTAVPRHCGNDMMLNTPRIPLAELDSNATVLITTQES